MWWLLLLIPQTMARPALGVEEVCVLAERPDRPIPLAPPPQGTAVPWHGLRGALLAQALPEPVATADVLSYLPWDDPDPGDEPVSVTLAAAPHPDRPGRSIVRVGVRSKPVDPASRGPVDLVVLVDVSPSMTSSFTNSFPALHQGEVDFGRGRWPWTRYPATSRVQLARSVLRELVAELGPEDRLAVISFDEATRVLLPPSPGAPHEPLLAAFEELVPSAGRPEPAVVVAQKVMADLARPCGDKRYLIVSDGGPELGGDARDALETIQRAALQGSTWSGLTLGKGPLPSDRLEVVAWAGYGHHGYADTPWDARRTYREMLLPGRTIARDATLELDFGGATARRLDAEGPGAGLPPEIGYGLHHVALFEVDAPIETLAATASWSVGSPVPGEWRKQGRVALTERPASMGEASPDLRVAWAAYGLATHAVDGQADWEALAGLVQGARPHHGVDLELTVLLARAAGLHLKR